MKHSVNAGFGFRCDALEAALHVAWRLNATLVFDKDAFYQRRSTYDISAATDKLLGLRRALPQLDAPCLAQTLRRANLSGIASGATLLHGPAAHAPFDEWWARHGAEWEARAARAAQSRGRRCWSRRAGPRRPLES